MPTREKSPSFVANAGDHEAERGEALRLRVDRFAVLRIVACMVPPCLRLRRCAAPRGGGILRGLFVQGRHAICPCVDRRPRSQPRASRLGFALLAWTSRGGPADLMPLVSQGG